MAELIRAIKLNQVSRVSQLLAAGVDPTENDNLAIITAARQGNGQITRLLLDNPDVDPQMAFLIAAEFGKISVVYEMINDPRIDPISGFYRGNENVRKIIYRDSRAYSDPRIFQWAVDHRLVNPRIIQRLDDLHPQWELWLDQVVRDPKSLAALAWRKMINVETKKF